MKPVRMEMPESVAPMQVIQVIGCRGAGTAEDPVRHVYQYYSMDGRMLAERDTFEETAEIEEEPMVPPVKPAKRGRKPKSPPVDDLSQPWPTDSQDTSTGDGNV